MLLSWARAFTVSKLPGSPESLAFWLSLEWHKPTDLSGSESQMKVGDGLNSRSVPPGSLDGYFSVLSELFKDKEIPPIWGDVYWLHLLKFTLLIHFSMGELIGTWPLQIFNEFRRIKLDVILLFFGFFLCWKIIYLLAFGFLIVSL